MRTLIKMLKRTRSSAGIAVAAFLVIAGVGAGLTLADTNDPNTPVYDTILGETVPLSFQQALEDAFPSGTDTSTVEYPAPAETWPSFAPRVVTLDLDSDYRSSYDNIEATSAYQQADGEVETDVTAGADDEDLDTGRFIRQDTNFSNESTSSSTADVPGTGEITITGFKGDLVFWKSESGEIGTYSLSTSEVALDQPPDCSGVSASPSTLWPANHKLVMVQVSGATDPDGDSVTLTIDSVTQDEPVNGTGDGDISPDAVKGVTSDTVQLRAERDGSGDGRVYRLHVTADDGRGGTCEKTVTVGVPHDKGKGATAIDSGDSFDSFGS